MTTIALQDDERDVLAEVLEKSLSGLIDEIAHTDNRDYKEFLKQRKETLLNIQKRLQSGA